MEIFVPQIHPMVYFSKRKQKGERVICDSRCLLLSFPLKLNKLETEETLGTVPPLQINGILCWTLGCKLSQ